MAVITATLSEETRELVIRIDGRFDFGCHQQFREAFERYLPAKDIKVVVDLGSTSYLDSSALGMLLLLRDHAGGEKADIRLINASSDVKKILGISNFTQLFSVD
ncbi:MULTISPECIES: STAS domain-containing protein [Pseudomonas]|uniref:STAS domain-containing protein n=1 Tax=Pseudomonas TaxID=286 RepID=UPI00058AF018|nr:STAS domain-containing protein [Pseudomonas massiliensis]